MDWFKRRLQALEGNAVWAAILHWWPALSVFMAAAILWFTHLSVPAKVLVCAPLATVGLQILYDFRRRNKALNAPLNVIHAPIQEMLLELTPHGNNSSLLCLEVKNKGDDAKFTATIRVVSRSYGGPVDTRPYTGRWTLLTYKRRFGDHRPKPTALVVTIPSGDYRILEIAKQHPENGRGNEISAAQLVGFDEFLRWDFEPKPDSKLPSLRLQIQFLAEGGKSLYKIYDVGPVAACGPLGMTEVTV